MNYQRCFLCLATILIGVPAAAGQAGENIALGKKYTLSIAPDYPHCTDPGDATQLTDGKTVEKDYFWTQQGTVGWSYEQWVEITVDLERVEPISGVSFRTAAGASGIEWPSAIHILASDDGKSYRDCGDLVVMDIEHQGPWPKDYAVRRLTASELRTRGRYVRFFVFALPHIFCDEVEIFRGAPELLQGQPGGTPVADLKELTDCWKTQFGARHRFEGDIDAVGKAIDASPLADPAVREALRVRWKEAGAALRTSAVADGAAFRAVLTYNEAHARLFQVQAALWKAQGRADLTYGVPATWDPADLSGLPPTGGQVEVHTMRGEYRAAAVNLANASAAPIEVRVRFDGLPGAPAPSYVAVHEVPWTDTVAQGQPVAAALPLARHEGAEWRLTVLPGLVRQIWLTFHVQDVPPGEYTGKMTVESPSCWPVQVPVRLRVYPLDFPKQTTLQQGGFDFIDGSPPYGITPQNRQAYLACLKDHFVNVPWANGTHVMLRCSFSADGTPQFDTQAMDDWLALWPNAPTYYIHLARGINQPGSMGHGFGGEEAGTAEFHRKVGAWISAWVRHLAGKGISPERLTLLIHDEPREECNIETFLAWAKAIRAAEPKVRIWEDPYYQDPTKAPAELFDASDILCPNRPMWLEHSESFAQFYRQQQRKGRTLNLYSCSGPSRLLDPYSYYRLQAWHCRQIGATASFFWAFYDNTEVSSWNEYLIVAGGYTPLFLDDASVTTGKQMEAIREGVEDFEYFVLLRNAVDKAKTAGRSDSVLAQAESLLTAAVDEVLTARGASEIRWHAPKDRTKADTVRIRILEALIGLQGG